MFSYFAYGLGIQSALPLPELERADAGHADVTIHVQQVERWSLPLDRTGTSFHVTPREAHLFWGNVGAFLVRNGNEIIIDPLPWAEERLIRLPLLGVVFAMLLHQRRQLVLHASAVAVNGQAVIFLGSKGQGKSTMAAALYRQGHTMLADDIVALVAGDAQNLVVFPGFPQFKLWPEAAAALGDNPQLLPVLATGTEKRARCITERFSQQPLPLSGIYVLTTGTNIHTHPLPPREALVQLMMHTSIARFSKQLLFGAEAANHLHRCTRIVRQVPIYALERPRDLDQLLDVARLVERRVPRERATSMNPTP